ncbi:glycoside hydrolase family 104 protein [Pluralibacter gergoviae]|uniref:Glycoside hydrolase family 104 protein n=1 Tax=Pluralibacter gergoviae TaxID=61647 RepID=A0AAI9GJP5_PLUGE|nr:glycoside hydrolase family 104 protein [Pluralibacter gergoviae]EKV9907711.1 glycoside hydrolase family 104 protein [Pluralibacter gergoviae]EKW7276820.1 glycoside hydrolase family 104 protein [Pluralibacter gergoviae]ELD4293957.1 glycoside hydrolase family 104 protein [Pluralibacter gergoviae]ELD4304736.1 glycoside hydrolase family 104 protein [Pluralibacter gergoviae]
MSETIDSLLVTLGLQTDDKAFKKAESAIKSVTDGLMQLGAMAGVGFGASALTFGVSKTTLEMDRLSKITGFTVKQINGLKFAIGALGGDRESALDIVQKIPQLQQMARQGELRDKAYWSNVFSPSEFADKNGIDAIRYLTSSYEKMNNDQRRTLRNGIGIGDNDQLTRLIESGSGKFEELFKEYDKYHVGISPELVDSSNKFNLQMSKLHTNFENMANQMSGPLLKAINAILEPVNKFINSNPDAAGMIGASTMGAASYLSLRTTAKFIPKGTVPFKSIEKLVGKAIGKIALPVGLLIPENDTPGTSEELRSAGINWWDQAAKQFRGSAQYAPSAKRGRGVSLSGDYAYLSSIVDNPNVRAYLDMIAKSEGTYDKPGGGYNTMFGGGGFINKSDHPRVRHPFVQTDGKLNYTTAAGRYQHLSSTWDETAMALGLSDFSDRNQDIAALYLIQQKGQLQNVLNGNADAATGALGSVWASLPSSTYAQPKHSWNAIQGMYDRPLGLAGLPSQSSSSRSAPVVNQTNHVTINGVMPEDVINEMEKKMTGYVQQTHESYKSKDY